MTNKFESQIGEDAGATDLEDIDSRVENFKVPEDIMAAARKYTAEVASERDLAKWNGIIADWKILADSSPLYPIALILLDAETTTDVAQKETILEDARKEIRKYLESGKRMP